MPTVKLDCIEGAYTDNQIGERTHRRMAIVSGIPVTGITDPNALLKGLASAGMPQVGDGHPSGDGTKVVRQRIAGIANDQARVEIYYSSGNVGSNTGYHLRDCTASVMQRTGVVPGKGVPIQAGWANPNNSDDTVPPRALHINYRQPMQTIEATLDFASGETIDAVRSRIGSVNSRPWRGRDTGYWLLDGIETDTSLRDPGSLANSANTLAPGKVGGRLSARFVSRIFIDWSEYAYLERDGTPIYVAPATVTELQKEAYRYGIIGNTTKKGIVRVGPYPMTDFTALTGVA